MCVCVNIYMYLCVYTSTSMYICIHICRIGSSMIVHVYFNCLCMYVHVVCLDKPMCVCVCRMSMYWYVRMRVCVLARLFKHQSVIKTKQPLANH